MLAVLLIVFSGPWFV